MKLAILSDLHLDINPIQIKTLGVDDEQVDLVILAGDLHPDSKVRERFINDLEVLANAPVIFVPGNHDYWGFTPATKATVALDHKGMKIAGATLWTKLSPSQWVSYMMGLRDCARIHNWGEVAYNAAFKTQKRFLMQSKADIIVSHHAPSYSSVADDYIGDALNPCFMSDLDMEIVSLEKPPKLWVHGHVHQSHDYMLGNTRVICHPRGYSWEDNFRNYKARIIEV